MKLIVFGAGLANFLAVALAVKLHFVSTARGGGARGKFLALSAASVANILVFCREILLRRPDDVLHLMVLAVFAVSAALFAWSIQASRTARLQLIFEPSSPGHILRAGPYRYIRHPFYASYILFWGGCAVATLHPFNIAFEVALIVLLASSARREEKNFETSPLADDYRRYRRTAGQFWPLLRSANAGR